MRIFQFAKSRPIDFIIVAILFSAFILWGGTKPPTPPVITEEGINLTSFEVSADEVRFEWEAEDERLADAEYLIQSRRVGASAWETIGRTKNKNFVWQKFTVDLSRDYRIIVDITENE